MRTIMREENYESKTKEAETREDKLQGKLHGRSSRHCFYFFMESDDVYEVRTGFVSRGKNGAGSLNRKAVVGGGRILFLPNLAIRRRRVKKV